jgi:SagB-type dehydrogenase family enzyme
VIVDAPVAFGVAHAQAYASALRTDPQSANPDWRVAWDDGPWPVKVYASGGRRAAGVPGALARLLFATFAVTAVRYSPGGTLPASPTNSAPQRRGPTTVMRRPIPSGGAMYPTEAYVLLSDVDRLCHYDPYRLELVDLGRSAPGRGARQGLGLAADSGLPAAVLILTNRFWKNFYKYGDFAYRLGAVDVGVALGRAVRLASALLGAADVRTGFDDAVLNECIGLDGRDESVYAVVGLGPATIPPASPATVPAAAYPPRAVERSRVVKRSARFDAMHSAASVAPYRSRPLGTANRVATRGRTVRGRDGELVDLPPARAVDLLDLATMIRRTSNGHLFNGVEVSGAALATVLHETAEAVDALHRVTSGEMGADLALYCAVHRVSSVAPDWYAYRHRESGGQLVKVRGDQTSNTAREVHEALFARTVNVELAGFTVHVVAATEPILRGGQVRRYREQQLAVGVAVEAITLTAAALGLGSHPVLGFDAIRMDHAYDLDPAVRGTQAQVCVGAVRPDLRWEVSVRPL